MIIRIVRRRGASLVEIHSSCEFPVLPANECLSCGRRGRAEFSREDNLVYLAERMVHANIGRMPVETASPQRAYCEFLRELLTVPGVSSIVRGTRYSLTIRIGRVFDYKEVGREVADCVRRHFYPEELLDQVSHEDICGAAD